jgi:ATPase subunit of ABC transporter with duplicated ATPase domains
MEDILEIIIYLAIFLASIVGGLYKNYSKKKEDERRRQRQANQPQPQIAEEEDAMFEEPRETIPSSLEEFLQRQFEMDMSEPEKVEAEPEADYEEAIVSETQAKEGVAAFEATEQALLSDNMKEEGFSITKKLNERELASEGIGNAISDFDYNQEIDDFELRKAVIYSEIINRKYE